MIKIADKYFLTTFIKIFLISELAFIILFDIVDLIGFLDMFIDNKVPIRMIALYYFYFTPFVIGLTMPIAMLMASLLTTGQFVRFGESSPL